MKVGETATIRKLACGFLFAFHSNYASLLQHFGDKARYWSKIVIFHTPLHSTPPLGAFPSEYRIASCGKNRHFYVLLPSFSVCPGDAPVAITQNVAWMKRQFSACQIPRSMYPSIFNSFPVIRTASAKNRRFYVLQPTFMFPLETPLRLSCNVLHGWKTIQCLPKPRSMYLSICNSFRVIRFLSQCVSPKIAIFTTFWFPLGTPLGQSR